MAFMTHSVGYVVAVLRKSEPAGMSEPLSVTHGGKGTETNTVHIAA